MSQQQRKEGTGVLPGKVGGRIRAYLEVCLVSFIWFALVTGFIVGGLTLLGTKPVQGWAEKGLDWPVVVTLVSIFLLPYLVIAARAWRVNLSILGTRAENAPTGESAEPSGGKF